MCFGLSSPKVETTKTMWSTSPDVRSGCNHSHKWSSATAAGPHTDLWRAAQQRASLSTDPFHANQITEGGPLGDPEASISIIHSTGLQRNPERSWRWLSRLTPIVPFKHIFIHIKYPSWKRNGKPGVLLAHTGLVFFLSLKRSGEAGVDSQKRPV